MRTALALLTLLAATSLNAQPVRMTPGQAQQYRSLKLDVEVVRSTTYTTRYDVDGITTYPSSVQVDWNGYFGTDRVSEAEFYRIAGLDDLADRISSEQTRGKWFMSIGIPAFVGGTIVAIMGTNDSDGDDQADSPLMKNVGAGIGIVGIVLISSGRRSLVKQHTSPREAAEMALRYNNRLERQILSGQ